jgi:hypothetical protein
MIWSHTGETRRTGSARSNFLPTDDPKARVFVADIIGYLCGYAHLTNTRSLALLGDPDAGAYELLFSFASSSEKDQFLDLVRSNEDLGSDYIDNDFMYLSTEEIRNARPLAAVLPQDVMTHVTLVAITVFAGAGDIVLYRDVPRQDLPEKYSSANDLSQSAAFSGLN